MQNLCTSFQRTQIYKQIKSQTVQTTVQKDALFYIKGTVSITSNAKKAKHVAQIPCLDNYELDIYVYNFKN